MGVQFWYFKFAICMIYPRGFVKWAAGCLKFKIDIWARNVNLGVASM